MAVTADGRWAVSASLDKTLKVWDLGSGQLVRTLEGHTNWVNDVAVTADGHWAVSTSLDKTLRVWDLTTGLTVALLETHAPLHCCAFASDHLILAGDEAGALHFLDWHRVGTHPSSTFSHPSPPKRPQPLPAVPPAPPPPRPWLAGLTGPELHELTEALLSAYPTRSALAQMLTYGLTKNLDALTPERSGLRDTLFELLTTANAEGWIHPPHRRRPHPRPRQSPPPRPRRQAPAPGNPCSPASATNRLSAGRASRRNVPTWLSIYRVR